MDKIKIGVIADDFTGASDAASFLKKAKNRTILITSIPDVFDYDCDSIVIATKIRSIEPNIAVEKVSKTVDFFENIGVEKIYYKFCSTFDSTPKGNIGPVMDYLMERLEVPYTILCPSLPINGRTVVNGDLFVNDVPLDESPLKDHPLNPMWDSYIPNLMKPQSKYPSFVLKREDIETFESDQFSNNDHFYIIPDYETDEDAGVIYDIFKDLRLIGGGSGLLEYFEGHSIQEDNDLFDLKKQKAIILCGSCSKMTGKQVKTFKSKYDSHIAINAKDLLSGRIDVDTIFGKVDENLPEPTLVYSDGCDVEIDREDPDFEKSSSLMENTLASLSLRAKEQNFNKIIVAGGETSGAVIMKLGYKGFIVGDSVAPGVPVLTPIEDKDMRIILKSGNFGDESFFLKALEAK